jgi:diaminopimelate epimerase
MRIPFVKMHGLGNDFIVLDARTSALPEITAPVARALADRHTGIGCDQLIVLRPSETADFAMAIFNADGGEVEACGNATRAVGLLHGGPARIETVAGLLEAHPGEGGISVELGAPKFDWNAIPLADPMDTLDMPVGWEMLERPTAVNVGNPHVIFFVPDTDAIPLGELGPTIEHDPLFPERVNVNVATVENRDHIRGPHPCLRHRRLRDCSRSDAPGTGRSQRHRDPSRRRSQDRVGRARRDHHDRRSRRELPGHLRVE